jgi:hypothetical protein
MWRVLWNYLGRRMLNCAPVARVVFQAREMRWREPKFREALHLGCGRLVERSDAPPIVSTRAPEPPKVDFSWGPRLAKLALSGALPSPTTTYPSNQRLGRLRPKKTLTRSHFEKRRAVGSWKDGLLRRRVRQGKPLDISAKGRAAHRTRASAAAGWCHEALQKVSYPCPT